jgi:hypothetical protein
LELKDAGMQIDPKGISDKGVADKGTGDKGTSDKGIKGPNLLLKRSGIEFEQKSVDSYNNKERAGFTYITKDGMHYYYKTSSGETTSEVVKGYRSKLTVEKDDGSSVEYFCIERANGFRHLSPGTYTVTLTPRAKYPDNQEIYVTGNVFIHEANYPCFLDGCIAPGTEEWEGYGVKNTSEALKGIINALGGWVKDKKFVLEVKGEKTTAG